MDFQVITTTSEFEKMEREWNSLLSMSITNVPFLRHEYLLGWWKTRGGGEWKNADLKIITASDNGLLVGIAPLFMTKISDDGGFDNILMLLGSFEISDYLNFIVSEKDLEAFMSGLFGFLMDNPQLSWNRLDLYNIPDNSTSIVHVQNGAEAQGWEFIEEPFRPAVSVDLAGDFDSYLAGIDKKQRHEIRRKMRRAVEFDLPVSWHIITDEAQLEPGMDEFLRLMTFEPEKANFLTNEMRKQMKNTARAAWKAGWLQLSFLEVGDQKAAAYFNFDYNGTIWVYNSGMDPQFLNLSPGWVLLGHLLKRANEQGRSVFDFMRGDERYKFKFGGKQRFVQRIQVIKKPR